MVKTRTLTVGLGTLIMAALFAVQLWHGLTALYPPLTTSAFANIDIPIFGKMKYMFQSLFSAVLTFIGIQLTSRGMELF